MKKQQVLSVRLGDKEIVSKPFDFEALCRINDAHASEEVNGIVNYGRAAVSYMFEGTVLTDETLASLPIEENIRLCAEVWEMYVAAMGKAAQKKGKNA